jgi:predicted SnoaL-like aldol condensation-catalyzing enzyme
VKSVVEKCFKLAEDSGFLLDIRMRSKFIKTKEDSKFDVVGYFNELIHEYPKAKIINTRDENQEISVFSHTVLMEPIEQTHQTLNAVKKHQASLGHKIKQKI